jgi:hypothetical protein
MEQPDINELRQKNMIQQKNMMQKAASMATSVASRGLSNTKTNEETKHLRKLSCHGDGNIPPCSQRKSSEKFKESFYCGACGCGDKQGTQLIDLTIAGKENYGKLDYPQVWCPMNMPGFQPYKSTSEDPLELLNYRKKDIENLFSIEYITDKSKTGEPTK